MELFPCASFSSNFRLFKPDQIFDKNFLSYFNDFISYVVGCDTGRYDNDYSATTPCVDCPAQRFSPMPKPLICRRCDPGFGLGFFVPTRTRYPVPCSLPQA